MAKKTAQYVQVGETAMRDPATRKFLPSVPLYVLEENVDEAAEEALIKDIGALLALKFKAYKEGCARAGVAAG